MWARYRRAFEICVGIVWHGHVKREVHASTYLGRWSGWSWRGSRNGGCRCGSGGGGGSRSRRGPYGSGSTTVTGVQLVLSSGEEANED